MLEHMTNWRRRTPHPRLASDLAIAAEQPSLLRVTNAFLGFRSLRSQLETRARRRGCCAGPPRRLSRSSIPDEPSRQHLIHYIPRHVRQSEVSPHVVISQTSVLQAEAVKNRGLQIVHVNLVFEHVHA
jgi:hypothetical protein